MPDFRKMAQAKAAGEEALKAAAEAKAKAAKDAKDTEAKKLAETVKETDPSNRITASDEIPL